MLIESVALACLMSYLGPPDEAPAVEAEQSAGSEPQATGGTPILLPVLPTTQLSVDTKGESTLSLGAAFRKGAQPTYDVLYAPDIEIKLSDGRADLVALSDGNVTAASDLSVGLAISWLGTQYRERKQGALERAHDERDKARLAKDLEYCESLCSADPEFQSETTKKWCEANDLTTLDEQIRGLESKLKTAQQTLNDAKTVLESLDRRMVPTVPGTPVPEPPGLQEEIDAEHDYLEARANLEKLEEKLKATREQKNKVEARRALPTAELLCDSVKEDYNNFVRDELGWVGDEQDLWILSIGGRAGFRSFDFYSGPSGGALSEQDTLYRGAGSFAFSWGVILPPRDSSKVRRPKAAPVMEGFVSLHHHFAASDTKLKVCQPGSEVEVDGAVYPSEACEEIVAGPPSPAVALRWGAFFGVTGPKNLLFRAEVGPAGFWTRDDGDNQVDLGFQTPITFNALASVAALSAVKYNGVIRLIPSISWRYARDSQTSQYEWNPTFVLSVRVSGQRSFFGDALTWL